MRVTVAICTLNRCESLAKTLESVAASDHSSFEGCEILVVDNGSSDRTKEVVDAFADRRPGIFRYLFEPRPGKSFALNSAIRNSDSDVLAFLDDDVTVEPTWLRNIAAPLAHGEYAGVGGRTMLQAAYTAPSWLPICGPQNMGGILAALFDLGDWPCELTIAPYGTNMAYRRSMFEKHGLFRTDLGPSPNRRVPRPNEDTEFGRRLMAAGERLRYEPQAIVYHPVVESRVNKKYFTRWWFDFGRAVIREKGPAGPIFGIPRRYLAVPKTALVTLPVFALRWMTTFDPQKRFFAKCLTWSIVGQMVEIWRMPSRPASPSEGPGLRTYREEL